MTGRGRMEYVVDGDLFAVEFTCTFFRDTKEDTGWFEVDTLTVDVQESGKDPVQYENDHVPPAMWEEIINAIQTRMVKIEWNK